MSLKNKPKVSIVIPCYEMESRGAEFLDECLDSIAQQSFKDYEVIVPDQSFNNYIESVCDDYRVGMNITHFYVDRLPEGSNAAYNCNEGIKRATGDIIKILHQDDYFFNCNSLKQTVEAFTPYKMWLVSSYVHVKNDCFKHTHLPTVNPRLHMENTIGCPSGLAFRNGMDMLFDEKLKWLFDCEFYKRLMDKFGRPVILDTITIINRLWEGQATNTIIDQPLINKEIEYVTTKHGVTKHAEY